MLYKLLPLGTWFNTANTPCLLHYSLWKIHRLKTTRRCNWTVSVWWVQGVLLPPVMTQPEAGKHNTITPTISLPVKSWELRKVEAGNLDLVQYVERIYLSITWSNYRGQQYVCSAEWPPVTIQLCQSHFLFVSPVRVPMLPVISVTDLRTC